MVFIIHECLLVLPSQIEYFRSFKGVISFCVMPKNIDLFTFNDDFLCNIFVTILNMTGLSLIYTMVLVAANRYANILHHTKYFILKLKFKRYARVFYGDFFIENLLFRLLRSYFINTSLFASIFHCKSSW